MGYLPALVSLVPPKPYSPVVVKIGSQGAQFHWRVPAALFMAEDFLGEHP